MGFPTLRPIFEVMRPDFPLGLQNGHPPTYEGMRVLAKAVISTEQALVLRPHGFVAFAGRILQALKVGDPDRSYLGCM